MAISVTFSELRDLYWKYYISLEDQFMETARYVEFDYINNGKTYSLEYLKLFQAVCSEIDIVGKALASYLNDSFKPTKNTGINEWWYFITQEDPTLKERVCNLLGKHDLKPWFGYSVMRNDRIGAKKYILDERCKPKSKTPSWWNDYNSVKHNRTGRFEKRSTNYAKANLRNLFLAFSGLYSLEVKLMETAYMHGETMTSTDLESRLFLEDLPFYTHLLRVGC
ncbi:MAG TPA: hypothetical protein DCP91_02920 [Eggerthellaceae bacterium]|nr:hypothetical protein [Eggerthellaceae bacterium]